MEYASPVWNSIGTHDSDVLEKVQKQCTRKIFARCHLKSKQYGKRLERLNLEPLWKRRSLIDLTFAHKVYWGHHKCPGTLVKKKPDATRILRHTLRLGTEFKPSRHRASFWSQRIGKTWHKLSNHTIEQKTKVFAELVVPMLKQKNSQWAFDFFFENEHEFCTSK